MSIHFSSLISVFFFFCRNTKTFNINFPTAYFEYIKQIAYLKPVQFPYSPLANFKNSNVPSLLKFEKFIQKPQIPFWKSIME